MTDSEESASYRQPSSITAVYCELCDLPHRPGVVQCEECGHELGTIPDWAAVRRDRQLAKDQMLLGGVIVVGVMALSLWIFGGYGYVGLVGVTAWALRSAYRYRVLSRRLSRGAAPTDLDSPKA